MSTVPLLSELREPVAVGRFYMVPIVRAKWFNRVDDWPVIGPMHTDPEDFKFPHRHYHIDARFLRADQMRFAFAHASYSAARDKIEMICMGYPLSENAAAVWPERERRVLPNGVPPVRRRKCRAVSHPQPNVQHEVWQNFHAKYGTPEAIRRPDGRVLCPHRKVDLSSLPVEADGTTICPLHGLRVRCGEPA